MFYSNNTTLSVLARSCKENAVAIADIYKITSFDLTHLDSSCLKKLFWKYFAGSLHVMVFFSITLYILGYCTCF